MKKYIILLAVMVFFAVYSLGSMGVEINVAEDLSAYVISTLAPFNSYELSYSCTMYYPPQENNDIAEQTRNMLSEYRRIVKERTENTLSKAEEEKWKHVSNDDFLKMIHDQEESLSGFQMESVKIYSAKDGKMRSDQYRTDREPKQQSYVFDGSEGVWIKNNNTLVKSIGNTRMWMDPTSCIGFGVNLNRFIQNGFSIVAYDSAAKKLRVNSDIYYPKTHYFEFTLLDENPAYWKQCDKIENGVVFMRVLCDQFKEISGMLVPETVVIQRRSAQKKETIDLFKMTLSEARVNDVQFADDFFSIEPKENMVVENRER